jgi:hypothetical protein
MTNTPDPSTIPSIPQAIEPKTRRYRYHPVSRSWRRKESPRRGIPQNSRPTTRQLILDHLTKHKSHLTLQEVNSLVAIIGPAMEHSCAGRDLNADGFWGLHGWGKYLTTNDLNALDDTLTAIFARLDGSYDSGNHEVMNDHYCVRLMGYDLAEERYWRTQDPTRGPQDTPASNTHLPIAAIDTWLRTTAFDAGRGV